MRVIKKPLLTNMRKAGSGINRGGVKHTVVFPGLKGPRLRKRGRAYDNIRIRGRR